MADLSRAEFQLQLDQSYKDKAVNVIVASSIMLAAAYAAVALRFLSRRLGHAALGIDDWMIGVGLVSVGT